MSLFGKEYKAVRVRKTKGRNSKNSSKVFCYTIEDLQQMGQTELDEWFGQLDAVERLMAIARAQQARENN